MKTIYRRSVFLGAIVAAGLLSTTAKAQTIMFDDFTYSGATDAQLSAFNKWSIINGTSGPPEGGQYRRDNITFINDPARAGNTLMTLSTTVNGQTKATTHSRIETNGFEYFEGTYSARVYFSEVPFTYKDGNVQTFYTIVSSSLGNDGSKYSELDFEYMAADKWGISPDNKVLYLTSWNRYIPEPWQAWKRYFSYQQSFAGWHTYTVSCTDGVNVKYWIDNEYKGSHATTDNDGTSVYPRSAMQVAFANWIWNNVVGSSTVNRTTTMQVDWVLFTKNQELTPQQVEAQVATYRSQGLQRRNLAGNTYVTNPNPNQSPVVSLTAPANGTTFTAPASVTINATASDSDGSITKVEFFNGSQLLGTDTSSPYSYTWSNVAAGNYTIRAVATDNGGASTTSATAAVTVTTQSPSFDRLIQAESYSNMGGVQLETTTDTGGGQSVGYIDTEDWMAYANITIPTSGNYTVQYRVASLNGGGVLSLDVNAGATVLGTREIPSTGGWQTWVTVSHTVYINAGTYNFGIYAQTGGWNINWWRITSASANIAPTTSESPVAAESIKLYPNPSSQKIQITSAHALDQAAVEIQDANGTKVFAGVYPPTGIDISSLKPGLYILKVRNGNSKADLRFVKE